MFNNDISILADRFNSILKLADKVREEDYIGEYEDNIPDLTEDQAPELSSQEILEESNKLFNELKELINTVNIKLSGSGFLDFVVKIKKIKDNYANEVCENFLRDLITYRPEGEKKFEYLINLYLEKNTILQEEDRGHYYDFIKQALQKAFNYELYNRHYQNGIFSELKTLKEPGETDKKDISESKKIEEEYRILEAVKNKDIDSLKELIKNANKFVMHKIFYAIYKNKEIFDQIKSFFFDKISNYVLDKDFIYLYLKNLNENDANDKELIDKVKEKFYLNCFKDNFDILDFSKNVLKNSDLSKERLFIITNVVNKNKNLIIELINSNSYLFLQYLNFNTNDENKLIDKDIINKVIDLEIKRIPYNKFYDLNDLNKLLSLGLLSPDEMSKYYHNIINDPKTFQHLSASTEKQINLCKNFIILVDKTPNSDKFLIMLLNKIIESIKNYVEKKYHSNNIGADPTADPSDGKNMLFMNMITRLLNMIMLDDKSSNPDLILSETVKNKISFWLKNKIESLGIVDFFKSTIEKNRTLKSTYAKAAIKDKNYVNFSIIFNSPPGQNIVNFLENYRLPKFKKLFLEITLCCIKLYNFKSIKDVYDLIVKINLEQPIEKQILIDDYQTFYRYNHITSLIEEKYLSEDLEEVKKSNKYLEFNCSSNDLKNKLKELFKFFPENIYKSVKNNFIEYNNSTKVQNYTLYQKEYAVIYDNIVSEEGTIANIHNPSEFFKLNSRILDASKISHDTRPNFLLLKKIILIKSIDLKQRYASDFLYVTTILENPSLFFRKSMDESIELNKKYLSPNFMENLSKFDQIKQIFLSGKTFEVSSAMIECLMNLATNLALLVMREQVDNYIKLAKPKDKKLFELEMDLGEYKFVVLKDLDLKHFTVGAETHCCQRIGGEGERAAIDSFINPLAGVLLLTNKENKTIAQSYFHYVPQDNGYILDNIEKSSILNIDQLTLIYENYSKLIQEKIPDIKYLKMGLSGTKFNYQRYKQISEEKDPRHFEWKEKYTDYSHEKHIDLLESNNKFNSNFNDLLENPFSMGVMKYYDQKSPSGLANLIDVFVKTEEQKKKANFSFNQNNEIFKLANYYFDIANFCKET